MKLVAAAFVAGLWLLFAVLTAGQALACPASWYGSESGSITANGERFNPSGLTVAMRHRPFGGHYRITNTANGKSVIVRHNDYGPAKWTGRCADLSRGAAARLGFIHAGVANVRIERID